MALFEKRERGILLGVGIGIGATMLAREFFPAIGALGRPLLKAAVKSSLLLYDRGREASARLGETIEDLAAESRVELEVEAAANAAHAAGGAEPAATMEKVN